MDAGKTARTGFCTRRRAGATPPFTASVQGEPKPGGPGPQRGPKRGGRSRPFDVLARVPFRDVFPSHFLPSVAELGSGGIETRREKPAENRLPGGSLGNRESPGHSLLALSGIGIGKPQGKPQGKSFSARFSVFSEFWLPPAPTQICRPLCVAGTTMGGRWCHRQIGGSRV